MSKSVLAITFGAMIFVSCSLTLGAVSPADKRQAASAATRLRFAHGTSSATVSGSLTSRSLERAYIVGARAGQVLRVRVSAKTSDGLDFASVIVLDPHGRPLSNEGGRGLRLTQSGDYRIEVSPPGSFYREKQTGRKALRFTLSVAIE